MYSLVGRNIAVGMNRRSILFLFNIVPTCHGVERRAVKASVSIKCTASHPLITETSIGRSNRFNTLFGNVTAVETPLLETIDYEIESDASKRTGYSMASLKCVWRTFCFLMNLKRGTEQVQWRDLTLLGVQIVNGVKNVGNFKRRRRSISYDKENQVDNIPMHRRNTIIVRRYRPMFWSITCTMCFCKWILMNGLSLVLLRLREDGS
jgi:hypothetical protein